MNKKMLKYACMAVYEDILDLTNYGTYDAKIIEDNVKWLEEQSKKYNLDVSPDLDKINYAIKDLMDAIELCAKDNMSK